MSSALNLIIARGFGDMVRDTTLSYQRGKEMRRAADNDQRQADQLASARDFNLQSAQQNQAAALRGQARETDLMGERDALVAEIQAINEEGLRYMQSGQQPPADFLARAAAVQSRIPTLTARAAPVSSLSDVLAPQPKAAESTIGKLGADLAAGRITQADYDAAVRKATYIAPPTPTYASEVLVGPGGEQQLVLYNTKDPQQRQVLGNAPPKGGNKPTELQTKAATYISSMENAESTLDQAGGFAPSLIEAQAFSVMQNPEASTVAQAAANGVLSAESQRYLQSAYEWIDPIVRFRTGAALRADEFATYYKTYFPMAGDSPSVVKNKAKARKVAQEAIRKAAGPALDQSGREVDFSELPP